MLHYIPKKSKTHSAPIRNESTKLVADTGELLRQINELRLQNVSPMAKIAELKQLAKTNNLKLPILLIYLQSCYELLRFEVIATLEYIFLHDNSFLTELKPYEYELLLLACRSNNPQFFEFIFGVMDSKVDGANIIYNIVRNHSMTLLEHVLEQNLFPVTEQLILKLQPYKDYLRKEAHQLNNPRFFDWAYELFCTQSEQGFILSKVCYSGSFELLKHLIEVKKFNINAQMPNGATALMSTVTLLQTPMDKTQLEKRKKIIDYLIDNNAELFAQKNDKRDVFHVAVQVDDTITLCALDTKLKANKLAALSAGQQAQTLASNESQLRNIVYPDNLTILHLAIIHQAKKTIALLSRLFGVTMLDGNGLNLACFALNCNRPDEAESLLMEYPDLDIRATDKNKINILHRCAGDPSRIDSAKWLIEKKNFPLEDKTTAEDTALLVAAIIKNYTLINYLLWDSKRRPNVNAINNSRKHIGHYLAGSNNLELAIKFINAPQYHPDFLAEDLDGQNMLDKALLKGESHYPIVKACLLRIQSENKYIKRATSKAIKRKRYLPLYLKFLQHSKQNSDPDDILSIGDWILGGQTPLHLLAAESSIVEMEKHISDFDLDINVSNQTGQNVIAYLLHLNKIIKAQNFITKFKPDVANIDNKGSSVLHLAVEINNPNFLTWCLDNLRLNILQTRTKDNNSALDLAYLLDNPQIAELLWGRLNEIERLNYFFNATDVKQEFVRQQLSYDPFNINGVSLLHIAVRTENVKLTQACIETQQFSILENNKNSRNALDIAINKQNSIITRMLFTSLSDSEKLDYFITASEDKKTFLITSENYNPHNDQLLDDISESFIQELIDESSTQYPSIAEEAIQEEECIINQSITEVFNIVADELILGCQQQEHQKLIADKQSLTTALTGVHSQLQTSFAKRETRKLASEVAIELVDDALENVFKDEMRIAQAVIDRDYNFFNDLENDKTTHALLRAQAANIINLAILQGNPRFTKFILDFELISADANFEHLYKAKYLNQRDIEKVLRVLPSVQQSTPTKTVEFKETEAEGILSKPECMKNPFYAIVLKELGDELSKPEFAQLRALLYGGGNIKEKPGDLDILFSEVNSFELDDLVQRFINKLVEVRGASLVVRSNNKTPSTSPVKSPRLRNLRVIPIEWLGCRIEFIITPRNKEEHSQSLDYTINALYYDIVAKQMYEVAGINARADFIDGILNTITPPEESFQDLRRIFRGVRLLALEPRFMFSFECVTTIKTMFSASSNPFLARDMSLDQLMKQLAEIYSPQHNKPDNLFHLSAMNILPHIINFLHKRPGEYNEEIIASLEKVEPCFYPQVKHSYCAPKVHNPKNGYHHRPRNKKYTQRTSQNGLFAKSVYTGLKELNPQAQSFVAKDTNGFPGRK